ncbi:citrate synthase/methylcitrate synthase [Planctomonas sp. JC2975]|uniref:citrate/2-methylcitrate synthase n=1 Tax=Planctomonas sp. JC2975 TaxID=2729626 RepID=UPI001473C380|nr:citrate/2-methylcitrate synthase [Planctomonas sp. JC2975]NNC12271.1 citrate synthase/methylcitrate synthase [Planctomonas sp. JC2975]
MSPTTPGAIASSTSSRPAATPGPGPAATASATSASAAVRSGTPAPAAVAPVVVPRGLAGVVVAETSIGDVLGTEGRYHYRGHDAIELAAAGDFEAAWQLLVLGTLPEADAAAAFRDRVAALRTPPAAVLAFLESLADPREPSSVIDPLRGLQATLPVLAAVRDAAPLYDLDEAARVEEALVVGAVVPSILAAFHRASRGLDPFVPEPMRRTESDPQSEADRHGTAQGAVAEYLRLVTDREPDERAVHALSAYLVATLDHGFNASTFTTRVIASTGADMASCIVGGLGALSGPLHGGAPSRALDALDAVAGELDGSVDGSRADAIERYVRGELAAGRRLMGFGHAVYRTADPRSRLLRRIALDFGGPRVELAVEYEQTAERLLAQHKPGRDLHTNVEFYAAVVLEQCGIPREMFTPTFAMARVIGWTAHVLEQARDRKIIRPSSRYAPATSAP